MKKWFALAFLAAAACSGGDEDDGPMFEMPQILPVQTPACVTSTAAVVGDSLKYDFAVNNRGRETLLITGGELVDDDGGHFRYSEMRLSVGSDPCTDATPCALEYLDDSAFARFFYEPTGPGWHSANLLIYSNAENFPILQTYVLARARPEDDPDYVFGDKPADAQGACD
ncbi:MAG: hypothetical protein RMA76_43485 [Deltaproteobacteria bacterium]|jgi:hypothetical protein